MNNPTDSNRPSDSISAAIALLMEERIHSILAEYAGAEAVALPLVRSLQLRADLGIESFSLVSIVVRLSDDLGIDPARAELELQRLETVGDLIALGETLSRALSEDAKAG